MFAAEVSLCDLGSPIQANGDVVTFGGSRIDKFDSQFLKLELASGQDKTAIWIGEGRDPVSPSTLHDISAYRTVTSAQGVKIVLDSSSSGRVTIARTEAAGCPIYIARNKGRLVATWQFETAVKILSEIRPNELACKRFLEFGPKPVREQVIEGLFMLWPGEQCTFSPDQLIFEECAERHIVQSAVLLESARVTDHFVDLLAEVLKPLLDIAKNPMLELSGGMDSSCVAIGAAKVRPSLNSYAFIQHGATGIQQSKRRNEIVNLLGLRDGAASSHLYPPFKSVSREECSVTPYDDIFRSACLSALDEHPVSDIDLLITGIGGDELTMENTIKREVWEVRSSIASSSLDAAAGRADMFMRRGIWLAQPLTSRAVVDFCRALPREMRRNRQLNLLTLARAGLSDGYLFPRYAEHYGAMTLYDAATYDFDAAFSDSVIAEYHIANIDDLLHDARSATLHGFSYELVTRLWLALKLDTVLKRYVS